MAMRTEDFERWTAVQRRRRPATGRLALVACGLAFLVIGFGALLLELRGPEAARGPAGDASLRLSVPDMQRVDGVPVNTGSSGDEGALRWGAMRLAGAGLPWQREANVYISGHRLGYPGTGSFLIFRDLNKLGSGDEVQIRDDKGRIYLYRVFDKRVVKPGQTSVTEPVEGRNIVTLQSCTLPDYRKRLIVRAELTDAIAA